MSYKSVEESTAKPYIDPTPMPAHVPHTSELGVTSAPLKSAAFFLGAYCKEYNEDFMLCKNETRDPEHCLKEGRRVTRCAADFFSKLRDNCAASFDKHWQCLEQNNQEYYRCRTEETTMNQCVFETMGLKKDIPGSPEGKVPIHEKKRPIYKRLQQ